MHVAAARPGAVMSSRQSATASPRAIGGLAAWSMTMGRPDGGARKRASARQMARQHQRVEHEAVSHHRLDGRRRAPDRRSSRHRRRSCSIGRRPFSSGRVRASAMVSGASGAFRSDPADDAAHESAVVARDASRTRVSAALGSDCTSTVPSMPASPQQRRADRAARNRGGWQPARAAASGRRGRRAARNAGARRSSSISAPHAGQRRALRPAARFRCSAVQQAGRDVLLEPGDVLAHLLGVRVPETHRDHGRMRQRKLQRGGLQRHVEFGSQAARSAATRAGFRPAHRRSRTCLLPASSPELNGAADDDRDAALRAFVEEGRGCPVRAACSGRRACVQSRSNSCIASRDDLPFVDAEADGRDDARRRAVPPAPGSRRRRSAAPSSARARSPWVMRPISCT